MVRLKVVATQPTPVEIEGEVLPFFQRVAARLEDRFFQNQAEEMVKPMLFHFIKVGQNVTESVLFVDGPETAAKDAYGHIWLELINRPETVAAIQLMEAWVVVGDKTKGESLSNMTIRPSQHPKRQEVFVVTLWCEGKTFTRMVPFSRRGPKNLPVMAGEAQVFDSTQEGGVLRGRMMGDPVRDSDN